MSKVKSIDDSNLKRKIQRAFLESGLKIQNRAKERCPVDLGKLRASIRLEQEGSSIKIGTVGVPYAEFVEYGTGPMVSAHGVHDPSNPVKVWDAKTKRGGGMNQTMPFLRTALFEVKSEIPNIFEKVFR